MVGFLVFGTIIITLNKATGPQVAVAAGGEQKEVLYNKPSPHRPHHHHHHLTLHPGPSSLIITHRCTKLPVSPCKLWFQVENITGHLREEGGVRRRRQGDDCECQNDSTRKDGDVQIERNRRKSSRQSERGSNNVFPDHLLPRLMR